MKFYTWLMHQRWRSDPIGDLARDANRDPRFMAASTWSRAKKALPRTACRGAHDAVFEAWQEYELYLGGPSQQHPGTWVYGVTGGLLGGLPAITPRSTLRRRAVALPSELSHDSSHVN